MNRSVTSYSTMHELLDHLHQLSQKQKYSLDLIPVFPLHFPVSYPPKLISMSLKYIYSANRTNECKIMNVSYSMDNCI